MSIRSAGTTRVGDSDTRSDIVWEIERSRDRHARRAGEGRCTSRSGVGPCGTTGLVAARKGTRESGPIAVDQPVEHATDNCNRLDLRLRV